MESGKRNFPEVFQRTLGRSLDFSVCLADYSHFRIGGDTDYFFCARSADDLKKAITLAREFSVYHIIMGGGYNLLFEDEGFRGLVIKNKVNFIERQDLGRVRCASGAKLKDVLEWCTTKDLGGLEFMAGIPGTLGGAVYGNAGAFDEEIGDHVVEAVLYDESSREVRKQRDYFSFDYRYSSLKENAVVLLEVILQVEERERSRVEATITGFLEQRKTRHPPWDVACAGSFFQNPVFPDGRKVAAAKLLDRIGAKGSREGDAMVYEGHANFIINGGNATSKDVLRLASELKRRVREEFGIDLKEEVIHVPATPPAN
ncbi:MAG: UDP-N-acetylmuramate dehydrogenase [Candidatus Aminicenantes bacterium]|jgi:UDP-N-acetylmuramate dehydrogenase